MKCPASSYVVGVLALASAGAWSGCSSSGGAAPSTTPNVSSGQSGGGSGATSGSSGSVGASGSTAGSGVDATSGAGASGATSGSTLADSAAPAQDAPTGTSGSSLTDAAAGDGTTGGDAKTETGSPTTGNPEGGGGNCNLPATVSFTKDVLPFLIPSCGGSNGCHVIDAQSTTAGGGFDHGYDWITAGAHPSSCPTGAPKRFEVTIAVIEHANPPSCSNSRIMPPPGSGRTPLTTCQIAALQAWLNEPMVTQLHRPDTTSPTTPYPMPPYN